MVDLRYEFDNLMDEFSSNFLLVKNNRKQTCLCVDSLSRSAKQTCPVCLGTGFINRVEKIRGRFVVSSSIDLLPKETKYEQIGNIAFASKQFYLKHDISIDRKDLIILCDWKNEYIPAFNSYSEIYEITNIDPARGDTGRIEYVIASAKNNPIEAQAKFYNIKQNASRVNYYITVR